MAANGVDGGARLETGLATPLNGSIDIEGELTSDMVELPPESRPVAGGAFGDMFIGKIRRSNVKLALKRARFTLYDKEGAKRAIKKLREEAHLWSRLKHDNVLRFLGIIEMGCEVYLVSQWMEFGDLATFVKQRLDFLQVSANHPDACKNPLRDPFSNFSECRTILQLADGLAYLHEMKVVHGDIKSNNVLLGQNLQPLFCDFGISKLQDYDVTSIGTKHAGSVRHMSPERLIGGASRTFASDVYAFGITIFEILSGTVAFPLLNDVSAVTLAIYQGCQPEPLEPLSRGTENFSLAWDIARRCWLAEPAQRPSASQIHQTMFNGQGIVRGDTLNPQSAWVMLVGNIQANGSDGGGNSSELIAGRSTAAANGAKQGEPNSPPMGAANGAMGGQGQNEPNSSAEAVPPVSNHPGWTVNTTRQQQALQSTQQAMQAQQQQQQQQAPSPLRARSAAYQRPLAQPPSQPQPPGTMHIPAPAPNQNQGITSGARKEPWDQHFWTAFQAWLTNSKLHLDKPMIEGKDVDLAELFLLVGGVGGFQKANSGNKWSLIGGQIGFPHFQPGPGEMPLAAPHVAEQLAKIYERLLLQFELHWYASLGQYDYDAPIPLPPDLQHFHPRLQAMVDGKANTQKSPQHRQGLAQGPMQHNQLQAPLGGVSGNQQQPTPGPSQADMVLSQAEKVLAMSADELRRSGYDENTIKQIDANRAAIQAAVNRKKQETLEQMVLAQQQQQQIQQRQLEQQQHQHVAALMKTPAIAAARPPSQTTDRPMPPPSHPNHFDTMGTSVPEQAQQPPPAGPPQMPNGGMLQNQPMSGLMSMPQFIRSKFSPEQFEQATNHTKGIMTMFMQKGVNESFLAPQEHWPLIERQMQLLHALAIQAASNLPAFFLLLPREEQELKQVIFIISQMMQQRAILQSAEPKRFIFGLQHLAAWQQHLTAFLMRLKTIFGQAQALGQQEGMLGSMQPSQASMQQLQVLQQQSSQILSQNSFNPGQAPPRPPTAEPTRIPALPQHMPPGQQQHQPQQQQQMPPPPPPHAPAQGPGALPKGPNIAKKFNKGPSASAPSPAAQASTPPNHAPTPAASTVVDSPSAPKSPLITGKPAGKKKIMKPPLPPNKKTTRPTKSTPVLSHAEVPTTSRPGSKRGREEEERPIGEDPAASSSAPTPKRPRVDPRDELDAKRAEDAAAARTSAEAALAYLDVNLKELEALSAHCTQPIVNAAPDLHTILRLFQECGLASQSVPAAPVSTAIGVALTEELSSLWATTPAFIEPQPLNHSSAPGRLESDALEESRAPTEPSEWWDLVCFPGENYFNDDSGWKWDSDVGSDKDWPIIYPELTPA